MSNLRTDAHDMQCNTDRSSSRVSREFKQLQFWYNKDKLRIESDDPNTWVEVFGAFREGPDEYLLVCGKKKIGFNTAVPGRLTPDRTPIWDVSAVCVPLQTKPDLEDLDFQHTNYYRFSDREEQGRVVAIIRSALSIYSGIMLLSPPIGKAFVEFTPELTEALESGAYISSEKVSKKR